MDQKYILVRWHSQMTFNLFSGDRDDAVHVGRHVPRQDDGNVGVNDFSQVTNLTHTSHHITSLWSLSGAAYRVKQNQHKLIYVVYLS